MAKLSMVAAVSEMLETRRMMSASIAGVLVVRGTADADEITISLNQSNDKQIDVDVNGDVSTFRLRDVESIRVLGLGGDDTISLDGLGDAIEEENIVKGGAGSDDLTGSAGDEIIRGGADDDTIDAGAGDDAVFGGSGTDDITGGDGEDEFSGKDADSENKDIVAGDDGVRIALADAPPKVRQVINHALDQSHNATLDALLRESDEGQIVFEAEFTERKFARSLKLKPNGIIVEDEKEIELADLPPAVLNAILDLYPDAEFEEVEFADAQGELFYETEIEVDGEVGEIKISVSGEILEDELA